MPSFGDLIKKRRRELALTQVKVAARIIQDDGKPLSMQYLNDIENGRRGAPPDYMLKQLAKVLRVELDLLYFRAGRIPPDLQKRLVSDARAVAAFAAFRAALRPRRKKS
jgi:transcriptional regulator with XRE-family HTH domain